jgi:type I restriction enzyme M protein
MNTVIEEKPDYQAFFKNMYYDLYSNSNTSRAERIVSDITKLLLCKLMLEKNNNHLSNSQNYRGTELLASLKKNYPQTCDQFDDFSLSDETIKSVMHSMNKISLLDAPGHIIGDAFQAIIGPSVRGDKGQFFTPKSLVDCMVEIVAPNINEIVMDPACGTGGFLSAAYLYQHQWTKEKEISKGKYIGIDKDRDMADLTLALTEIITKGHSEVYNRNSLELLNPQNELHYLLGKVDVILTNPPFGSKIGVTDKDVLKYYDFGYNWTYSKEDNTWYQLKTVVKSQDPQILFLELCVNLLREGGRMGIVLPEGAFGNKSLGYIWNYLQMKGQVYAMIDCPRNTFQPSTDTKTNVLFFEKAPNKGDKDSWIAVAKHCGHDKRGRTTTSANQQIPNDFNIIGSTFKDRTDQNMLWKKATLSGQYFVPRYFANKVCSYNGNEIMSLGELIDHGYITIKSGHEVGSEAYGTGTIPFIRTSDINNFEISSDPTNSISEEIYLQYSKQQQLKDGDILFIVDGRYRIGKSAILNKYNLRCVVQSHIEILSLSKEAPFSPYEFFYTLNSLEVQEQIRNLVFIQSTLGTLGNRIKEIIIPMHTKTSDWTEKIHVFQQNIETRAKLIAELKKEVCTFEGSI